MRFTPTLLVAALPVSLGLPVETFIESRQVPGVSLSQLTALCALLSSPVSTIAPLHFCNELSTLNPTGLIPVSSLGDLTSLGGVTGLLSLLSVLSALGGIPGIGGSSSTLPGLGTLTGALGGIKTRNEDTQIEVRETLPTGLSFSQLFVICYILESSVLLTGVVPFPICSELSTLNPTSIIPISSLGDLTPVGGAAGIASLLGSFGGPGGLGARDDDVQLDSGRLIAVREEEKRALLSGILGGLPGASLLTGLPGVSTLTSTLGGLTGGLKARGEEKRALTSLTSLLSNLPGVSIITGLLGLGGSSTSGSSGVLGGLKA